MQVRNRNVRQRILSEKHARNIRNSKKIWIVISNQVCYHSSKKVYRYGGTLFLRKRGVLLCQTMLMRPLFPCIRGEFGLCCSAGYIERKVFGTGSGNLTELEAAINAQAAKGYRLHTITTSNGGSKGFGGGDRIQATMVFERIR